MEQEFYQRQEMSVSKMMIFLLVTSKMLIIQFIF